MQLRPLIDTEILPAIALVWEVFKEFEAPEYADEGVQSFRKFIEYDNLAKMVENGEMTVSGYFLDGVLTGVLAVRNSTHISLLFVKRIFHRQGIATMLFKQFAENCAASGCEKITVNSAPSAVGFYKKLGFSALDTEKCIDGIRFTPMQYLFWEKNRYGA